MNIVILGGTGKLGLAAATRFQRRGHTVMIGSRDAAKAGEAARNAGDGILAGTNGKSEVMDLIRSINLNPINTGSIEVAGHLERITVLLLSINKANKVKESGIKITGI